MALYEPPDFFEKAANAVGDVGNGFEQFAQGAAGLANGDPFNPARTPPTASGLATRQGQIQPGRASVGKRQAMRFIVPEQPIVEMYVNPQQVQYQFSKLINSQRAKGGYILQYWGENLGILNVQGTTGTSGIEGINVLYDVYRNEQLMFDPYALMLEAERDKSEQESFDDLLFGDDGPLGLNNAIPVGLDGGVGLLGSLAGAAGDYLESSQNQNIIKSRQKPTLASLAFTVEIYWYGEVFRGYFENFNYTEDANMLGIFNYNFTFKVTQKRGSRTNFLAWHKDPNQGQSNWGPGGPQRSFSRLVRAESAPTRGTSAGIGVKNLASSPNKTSLNALAVSKSVSVSEFDIL
jgi:hypothetical protein